MTNREYASDLQVMLAQGQSFEALDKYYADDCVIVEATGEARQGKEAQRIAIQGWYDSLEEMHASGIGCITSDEDAGITCVETWMDGTFKGGHRFKMEEVAVQKWKDGKIIHERFYYNMPSN